MKEKYGQSYLDNIEPVVRQFLDKLNYHQAQPKILRDAIWGFPLYEPYELALIDSPVFQRLRNIFQTSPTALLAVVDAAMAWWHGGGCNSPGAENEALARAVGELHVLGWEV